MSASSDYQTAYHRARDRIGAAWERMPLPERTREIEVEFQALANARPKATWQSLSLAPDSRTKPDISR
jgi:hypothetical protein